MIWIVANKEFCMTTKPTILHQKCGKKLFFFQNLPVGRPWFSPSASAILIKDVLQRLSAHIGLYGGFRK